MKITTTHILVALGALLLLGKKSKASDMPSDSDSSAGASLPMPSTSGKFPVDASKPRGIRNNNVGNIVISSSDWKGKVPISQNSDGKFEQFFEKKYGTRAMIKLLKNYISGGTNTINAIIKKYEAGSLAYIDFVVKKTGISQFTILNSDKGTLKKLVQAMAELENGIPCVSDYEFEEAYSLL